MSHPPHRRKKIWRILAYMAFTLVVLVGVALAWLSANVRSLEFAKPYVENAVSAAFEPFVVETGQMRYKVDTQEWTLVTGMQDVVLKDGEGHRVAAFSQVNLNLALVSLLGGSIRFDMLEIEKPALRLTTQADGRVTLSVSAQQEEDEQESQSEPLEIKKVIGALKNIAVKTVVVRDALLGIVSRESTSVYRLPRLMLVTKDRGEIFSLQFDAQIKESDQQSRITGSMDAQLEEGMLSLSTALTDFNVTLLAPFHDYGAYLSGAQMRLNGTAKAVMDFQGNLQEAEVSINSEKGSYTYPELEKIDFAELSLQASKARQDETLFLKEAKLVNDDMVLRASGSMSVTEEGVGADIEASLKQLKIDRIGAYWPPEVADDARKWVTTNLSAGKVPQAKAVLKFTPEDLRQESLPESILQATIGVDDATVGFLPGYPSVEHVNGEVVITARSLDIKADSGEFMRGTKLKEAHLRIPDFSAPGIPMEFSLTLDAPAADVAEMIGPKRLDLASALKLDPERITGNASGKVDFTLPLYSKDWPKDKPYITYAVEAALDTVSQDDVLGKWDFSGMTGTLAVNNEKLELAVRTDMQGVSSELGAFREFSGKQTTRYTLIADIPHEVMPRFGFDVPEQIQGILGVDAKVVDVGAQSVTEAKVNLSNTSITIPELSYYKMTGVPATLEITQETKGGQVVVPKLTYVSGDARVSGGFTQDKQSGEFITLDISSLKLGGNDFALSYKTGEGGRKLVHLHGASVDVSGPEEAPPVTAAPAPEKKEQANPLDALMNMRLELDVQKLLFAKDHGLQNLRGMIDCGKNLCPHVKLESQTAKGEPFTLAIEQKGGTRLFAMHSPDAGGVIKALDISDHVVDGTLDFKGEFDDTAAEPVLSGRFLISDFRVVKGPILAKLLSLASLTGFLDTLAGNGIAFTKLSADAAYSNGTILIKDGKAYGSAIGITSKGSIKPFLGKIDLEGTVVPAYTANSILGKIPLLGRILTGGEGGGVIAANYSMEGDGEDPNVRVNPLSLLTPGFLRNLFDVFDKPEQETFGESEAVSEEPVAAQDTAPQEIEREPSRFKREFPTIRKR